MKIFEADKSLKAAVNLFYSEQGYHGNWSETERAFVCTVQGQIVGSVKVEFINKVTILRGMYISENLQKQGIGARMLKHIEPILNQRTAYCMPLAHVAHFYKQIGFVEVNEKSYPSFLIERCNEYRNAGYVITTMRREQTQ